MTKSCSTCAYHGSGQRTIDDAPPRCWSCSNQGGRYPSWMPKAPGQGAPRSMADKITVIPIAKAEDPMKVQVGGSHYKELGIQPLEVMQALLTPEEYRGYLKGNLIKYSIRQGRKEGSDDAGKGQHYTDLLKTANR